MPPDRPPRGISNHSRAWLWVGLWALFMWGLGSEDLSYDHTSRFLGPLIRWLLPDLSQANQELIHFVIRKTAHLAEYGLLSVLTLRAFLIGRSTALPRAALLSLVLATAFAAADETRQSLSASRMGSGWDVLLDFLGGAAGIALLQWARTHLPGFDRHIGIDRLPETTTAEDTHGGTAE